MKTSKLIITTIILLTLISLSVSKGSCLDVSVRAIRARPSTTYNETAWGLGYTGKGINIAIIDSGVDDEHESLQGKFVAGADFHKPLTSKSGSYNPDDENGHGTHIAGIAMGTGGSEGKYKGVAPDAKLIDVRAEVVAGMWNEYKEAIEWCIENNDTDWDGNGPDDYDGIDIISYSHGGPDAFADLFNEAIEEGIVVVVSWSNPGDAVGGGTKSEKVIVVQNIDDKGTIDRTDDTVAPDAPTGPLPDDGDNDTYDELKPDISAYGTDIMSAEYSEDGQASDGYTEKGGTSMAAPHVAGVCALMLEANPYLTPEEVKMILLETAEQRGTPEYPDYPFPYNKWDKAYGCGIVDAYAAVKRALELRPPEPNKIPMITISSPNNNAKVSNTITISGTASDTDGNVLNVELKFDNNNWFNVSIVSAGSLEWNYTWNTKDVENGMHTIYARSYDAKNYSGFVSVDVNVYNKVSAGVEEKIKINPFYLISAAGIILVIVIIVVCVLLFRRRKTSVPSFPVGTATPPPVTGVPSVTAKCPQCGNAIEITSAKRPLTVQCPKCGAKGILR